MLFRKPPPDVDPLTVKRLLPTGMQEFEEWSDNIIAHTGLSATPDSQKFTLASMITVLPNTESAKEDLYFIKALHKAAANQIAAAQMDEIRNRIKSKIQAEELSKASKPSEVTPTQGVTDAVDKKEV